MLKHLLGFILFILLYNSVYSQAKSDTLMYYVRDDGSVVPNKENADYVLFILPKEEINNKKLYPIVGYYLDGKLKFSATSKTQSTDFVLEGSYITYFPNGKRRIIATSENGEAVGDEIAYYPNGNFYTHIKHERHQTVLFECRDSTGIVLAQNGNGNWKEFDNSFKEVVSSGPVKNGNRHGEWEILTGKASYRNGLLIGMISEKPIVGEAIVDANAVKFITDKKYLPLKGDDIQISTFNENQKKFPGNIIYAENGKKNNASGQVYIGFFVEKDSSTTDFKVLYAPSDSLGTEALRLAKLFTKWGPATQKGQLIRSPIVLPVYYSSDTSTQDSIQQKAMIDVQEVPSFPGGLRSFGKFLEKTITYPAYERDRGVMGKVYTTFIVEKDGSLSNLHTLYTPSVGLSEEALRVMRLSPKWVPGKAQGKPVRVQYTLPINFSLGY